MRLPLHMKGKRFICSPNHTPPPELTLCEAITGRICLSFFLPFFPLSLISLFFHPSFLHSFLCVFLPFGRRRGGGGGLTPSHPIPQSGWSTALYVLMGIVQFSTLLVFFQRLVIEVVVRIRMPAVMGNRSWGGEQRVIFCRSTRFLSAPS